MSISDRENRVVATDRKGVQNTELNCETQSVRSVSHTVYLR